MIMYHVTKVKNIAGILQRGLHPRGGEGFYPEARYTKRLYLFKDEGDSHNFLEELYPKLECEPEDLAILKVLVPRGVRVYRDPDTPSFYAEGFYILEGIPPGNIEVIWP